VIGPLNFAGWLSCYWFQVKEADMATIEDGEKWAAMQADWQAVNQESHTARFRVMQAFLKSAAGDGSGPTTAQLDLAEKLEQAADEKRRAMDEFVKKVFGVEALS
jgi:hypothetical protein